MHATQVPAPPAAAEKIRFVLSACRYEQNSRDYASRLVETLADVMNSEYAVWLNRAAGHQSVVSQTPGGNPLSRWLAADPAVPLLANDWNFCAGIRSIAAVPVCF